MRRLTVNKPVEEMNMVELAHNCCYNKDGYAWYRDFETDIDARELARDLMMNANIWEIDDNEVLSDEIFDEVMHDNLSYGSKEIEGLIALFYRNLWAMADLHTRLKAYEDAEEQRKWIPCSERLPEEDGEYLVWYDCGEDGERGFMLVPFFMDIEKFGVYQDVFHPETLGFLDSKFYECETAVAWMPLPEQYKG